MLGESSFWINKNNLTRLKFQWQEDYYAVSIGIDQLETLRKYIRNQVEHLVIRRLKPTVIDQLYKQFSEKI